jgi:two-component system, sensor histidine kinase and response regulator
MKEKMQILVVDDNQANLKVVGNVLKELGYKITLALSGENALKIIDEHEIDLILLDIMMPEMDGFEVCQKIKASKEHHDIPVIFLTAKNQTTDLVEGFKAGGVDFITKPFSREELIVRVNNHLELAASKKKIVRMNKTRDKLYSIIAHDIRSPLSGIAQTVDAIADGYLKPENKEFTEIFKDLQVRTSETLNLLGNLLEWTRAQGYSLNLEHKKVNMHSVVTESINFINGVAKKKGIQIQQNTQEDDTAFCDKNTINTAFRNLISNAVKFSHEGGEINISSKKVNHQIQFFVKDNGTGILPEIMNQILNEEQHVTTKGTNNERGIGLGLLMVKDFLKMNNGTFTIESTLGAGTVVSIMLPTE